ncbi:MAG: FKBP-type peptidyl-prolyl cis-trans isomerase [Cyclobacteriaceae bacterium]|jgi:FKBP-type peptidyl-prolyl cis-trans isomerase
MKLRVGYLFFLPAFFSGCLGDETVNPSFAEQLAKDRVIIDDYISSNSINNVLSDPENLGVKYKVNFTGPGIKPTLDDSIEVNYTIKLIPSGTEVEKSTAPVKVLLGKAVSGWQIGLPLITRGSNVSLFVPSGWAFGTIQHNSIPPNSNLFYQIDLLKVISQLSKDTIAIENYLTVKGITNYVKDPSGLRYKITKTGAGDKPKSTSIVTFNYEGKLLKTETIFDKSLSPQRFKLENLIKGLQIGMLNMSVGSKATFYIPSTLAYSYTGTQDGSVPPQSVTIFDIELTAIE